MQRLRNKELEQAQASSKPQVWRTKQTTDRRQPSANIQITFLLPSECRAPEDQKVYSDFDELGYEENLNAFSASYGKEASLESIMKANSRSKQSALKICLNG